MERLVPDCKCRVAYTKRDKKAWDAGSAVRRMRGKDITEFYCFTCTTFAGGKPLNHVAEALL
jgi:hypothetical protein